MKKINLSEAIEIAYNRPFNYFSDSISKNPHKALEISKAKLDLIHKIYELEDRHGITELYRLKEVLISFIEYLEYKPYLYKTNISDRVKQQAIIEIENSKKELENIEEKIDKLLTETYLEFEYA